MISMMAGKYLILISDREQIGIVCGKCVYRVSKMYSIPVFMDDSFLTEEEVT